MEVASAALSLAAAALDGLLKLTSSPAISGKVAAQLGVESDLACIRDEFAMMQAFLKTADGANRKAAKRSGKVVTTWVRQVRVLAYDVEDCLADSAMHLDRPSLLSCRRLPRSIKARRSIAAEIKKLRARVEDVSNRNLRYRLINDDVGPSRPASSLAGAGEDDNERSSPEARALTDLLISNNDGDGNALQAISVWGCNDHDRVSVSVVRDAYENPETKKSFSWRAWVKVSHPFNRHEFVKSLLMHFHTNDPGHEPAGGMEAMVRAEKKMMEESSIQEEFVKLPEKNKYLFVLDDLADAEVWLWIKACLPCHQNGSRIIVRTQHRGIAMMCPEQPILMMKSEINGLPNFHPDIYLLFHKGLQNGGFERTLEPEEGQDDSPGATRKLVDDISDVLEKNSLIGRGSDASKVISLVLSADKEKYVVVSGKDGIGKTALIKSVCHSMFERIAWIQLRDNLSEKKSSFGL